MTVKQFPKEKVIDFPEQMELHGRIIDLIYEYPDMSTATALGILDLVCDDVKSVVYE